MLMARSHNRGIIPRKSLMKKPKFPNIITESLKSEEEMMSKSNESHRQLTGMRLELPTEVQKRKSDFDNLLKNPSKESTNFFKEMLQTQKSMKKKKREFGSASPTGTKMIRKDSFKRDRYRFVTKKYSTTELDRGIKSIDEESKNSSSKHTSVKSSARMGSNLSISKIIAQNESETLSPTVKQNEKYIQKLKDNKIIKGGLLGRILNLKLKRKIGVQFIEDKSIKDDQPSRRGFMFSPSPSPRNFGQISEGSVSSSVSDRESEFSIRDTNQDNKSGSYDKSDSTQPRRAIQHSNMPGLFVQKLDSRQDSEESKTAEEFKRDSEDKDTNLLPILRHTELTRANSDKVNNLKKQPRTSGISIPNIKFDRRSTQQVGDEIFQNQKLMLEDTKFED